MILKTDIISKNKKLSDDFDRVMRGNDSGLPSGTWVADIMIHAETRCAWIRKSPNITWHKIPSVNNCT